MSQLTDVPRRSITFRSRDLLQPIVEAARGVFASAASSIFIYDQHEETLYFGAVAGAGADSLVGRAIPADTGIAGFVLRTRQSLRLDDLASSEIFDRDAAESTSYVPQALMAAPLLYEHDCVGVLEVLDWAEGSRGELADLALLQLIANQAAAAVRLLAASEWESDTYADPRGSRLCGEIVRQLAVAPEGKADAGLDMLRAVARMLGPDRP